MSKSEVGILRQELAKMSHKITELDTVVASVTAERNQLLSENQKRMLRL